MTKRQSNKIRNAFMFYDDTYNLKDEDNKITRKQQERKKDKVHNEKE